jgi:hypothetical protein
VGRPWRRAAALALRLRCPSMWASNSAKQATSGRGWEGTGYGRVNKLRERDRLQVTGDRVKGAYCC